MAKKGCGCKEKITQEFTSKIKPRCLTKKEFEDYSEIRSNNLSDESKQKIYAMHAKVFKRPVYIPEPNNNKPLIKMMSDLDKLYELKKQTLKQKQL